MIVCEPELEQKVYNMDTLNKIELLLASIEDTYQR